MQDKEMKLYIEQTIQSEINATLGKWTRRNAIFLGVTIVAMAIAWGQLTLQVKNNTEILNVGDRYTAQDAQHASALTQSQIDAINKRQDGLESWLVRVETKLDVALQK